MFERAYRALMLLLPPAFRARHGDEILDGFRRRSAEATGAAVRGGVFVRETFGLLAAAVGACLDDLGPVGESFRSLLPGYSPGELREPRGKARERARRQLRQYPELRELGWERGWRVWCAAWPAIARDRTVLRGRRLLIAAVTLTAAASPSAFLWLAGPPPPGQLGLWLVLVPLAPLVGVLGVGMPLSLALRGGMRRRVRAHLASALTEV